MAEGVGDSAGETHFVAQREPALRNEPKKRNAPVCTGAQLFTETVCQIRIYAVKKKNDAPQRRKPALKTLDLRLRLKPRRTKKYSVHLRNVPAAKRAAHFPGEAAAKVGVRLTKETDRARKPA